MSEPVAAELPVPRWMRLGPVVGPLAYAGGVALCLLSALRAALGPRPTGARSIPSATAEQLDRVIGRGLVLVGLAHVGMGSFLAMQAYFGATFVAGVGPVVGVGLVRNVAPLLAGFVLAGMSAATIVPELRTRPRPDLDADPSWVPDRDVSRGLAPDERAGPADGRLVLPRVLAAAIAGPVLSLWGAAVGIAVGCQVAGGVLGLPSAVFLGSFAEMLWMRDVVGLVAKGAGFGAIGALVACFEATRGDAGGPVESAAFRAAGVAMAAILASNLSWFFLAYLAGPPFGPTVLPT